MRIMVKAARIQRTIYMLALAPLAVLWVSIPVARGDSSAVFSTWTGFEVDKCASIWLIKTYIHPDAEIRFYNKDNKKTEGILFDTPTAKFRRYFNMSTYESLIKHYKINDPALGYIGKIIHDIEINTWEKKVMPETIEVRDAVNRIIWQTKDNTQVVKKSNQYFDFLYEHISEKYKFP
ncbi:MAG: hypothetical protein CSA25_06670 [Desulfobacter postgatei]|uniref:ChrB C-terminal domain-containing protein n=1 Tax=Desulfobacter postgatei TaxID=2293 RepID=A0A2G6MR78_9BACT|nr:MAG: hypothetical protein CSA25_06670 [Desulfobacter postgatei]